ncbi:MAG: hypothetical protein N4A36_00495 [Candidatus Gracilibacteria bacterium]|jgi:hypothetical protein|nr:hypothetical protein [Candidatus Gracilibacteria bacterium]
MNEKFTDNLRQLEGGEKKPDQQPKPEDPSAKLSPEVKSQCEELIKMVDNDFDRKKVEKWIKQKDEAEIKKKIAEWRPAFESKNSAQGFLKELDKAKDKISEIWDDKKLSPQEKAKQYEFLMEGKKTYDQAIDKIKDAKLAPNRKKQLRETIAALIETEDPQNLSTAIERETSAVIDKGIDTSGKISEQRSAINKLLDHNIDDITIFGDKEKKSKKKNWSDSIFKPFFTGKINEQEVFKRISKAEKDTKKEISDRKKSTQEFSKVRKIFDGLDKKSAKDADQDLVKGLAFGKSINKKRFEAANTKDREAILREIALKAKTAEFQDIYGGALKVSGAGALNPFSDSMQLARFVESQAKKFQSEMKTKETKGLQIKDWSDAYIYYAQELKTLSKLPKCTITKEHLNKWQNHLITCTNEIMTDLILMESQTELNNNDLKKLETWEQNASKMNNQLINQRLKKARNKQNATEEQEEQIEKELQAPKNKEEAMDLIQDQDQSIKDEILKLMALENADTSLAQEQEEQAQTEPEPIIETPIENQEPTTPEQVEMPIKNTQETQETEPEPETIRKNIEAQRLTAQKEQTGTITVDESKDKKFSKQNREDVTRSLKKNTEIRTVAEDIKTQREQTRNNILNKIQAPAKDKETRSQLRLVLDDTKNKTTKDDLLKKVA